MVLRGINVPEQFHGSGIAQKLLDRAERIAKNRGWTRIELQTDEGTRAFNFLKKNGFEVVNRAPSDSGKDSGYIAMEKKL